MGVGVLKYKKQYIYAGIITLVLTSVFAYYYQAFFRFEKFLPGVKIASLSVTGYSREGAVQLVDEWLNTVNDTPVVFYTDDYTLVINLKKLSEKPDAAKIIESIWEKEQKRGFKSKFFNMDGGSKIIYQIKLACDPNEIQKAVEFLSLNLNKDFKNASLEIDRQEGMKIIPGQQGQKVNVDATFAGMPVNWGDFSEIKIPVVLTKTEPAITEAQLSIMGELAAFSTWYNVNEIDRSHNLQLAASTINSAAVLPGEIFSFNRVVGERTYDNGYRDALIINNGVFEPGLGGGICQVSSTIYNAALRAGLEIVERHNHALAVTYVPLGHDATVAYGLQDFKFKNNTNYPIYIRAAAGSGQLTVNIYGHLNYKKKISLTSVTDKVIDFQEIVEIKGDMAPGTEEIEQKGVTGYVARSFRHYHDNDDKIIKTELLATDYYKPANRIIYRGPSWQTPPKKDTTVGNDNNDNIHDNSAANGSSDTEIQTPPLENGGITREAEHNSPQ